MMRYLFFTLLGFFGPALLMLFFRLLWTQVQTRWFRKAQNVEIIDVTPIEKQGFSPWFLGVWLALSISCTALLIWQMDNNSQTETTYIPAHIDASGKLIPAQLAPVDSGEKGLANGVEKTHL